ncbi:hypothetical protein [Zobellia alginiliquefaciens]|uniref:hypothetical protein n=1 Tax=Zobellia alginiliquefaciens TaxID=3032586 RepID=UPI0023E37D39|nr:hypothetical protein [Zobellia alginiliquefaciens]
MEESLSRQMLYGRVTCEKEGCSLEGLTVELVDANLLKFSMVKSNRTDKDGRFKIEVLTEKKDTQIESAHLQVLNKKGNLMYVHESNIFETSGALDQIEIKLPESVMEAVSYDFTRFQFNSIVKLNPNYFGAYEKLKLPKIPPIITPKKGDTKYEELECIGLYPETDELEAVFKVKLPYGFGGNLCSDGSKEYVSFYVDYGSGFQSVGPAVSVNTHSLGTVRKGPLCYAVKQFVDFEKKSCKTPYLVKVRAILSWNTPPMGPNYIPTWGNIKDAWVQIDPIKKSWDILTDKFSDISLVKSYSDLQVSKKELIESLQSSLDYNKKGLEKERVDFKDNILKNPNFYAAMADKDNFQSAVEQIYMLPPEILEKFKPKLIDPKWLLPVKPFNYNTNYEELTCVGLYPERDTLEATVAIKKQNGYKGNLCSTGSEEYVAFYVNWGDGLGYQHEGTKFFKAHDIPRDVNPLMYAVNLRVRDMAKKLKRCKEENIIRVRAILSWEIAPTSHTYRPSWGNVKECRIQVRPYGSVNDKCEIQHVNKVLVEDINSQGYARKVIDDSTFSPSIFDRPFGATIAIWGSINNATAVYYRMRFSDDNGATWNTVLTKRKYRTGFLTVAERTPDADGWFSVNNYNTDLGNYSDTPLANWSSGTRTGQHILRIELAGTSKVPIVGASCQVTVFLDNQRPEHFEFVDATIPQQGVTVKNEAGIIKKCGKYKGAEKVYVYGNFKDAHFNAYSLLLFGGNLASSGVGITPAINEYDEGTPLDTNGIIGATNPGNGSLLASVDMPAIGADIDCAYGIRMVTSDRTIRGYFSTYIFRSTTHANVSYVTFNWTP